MNIEQRLHKLNQGCYKNDKRSYFPFTSVTHSLSEHHVFGSKLSNKISYSQNIASGTKRVVRISLWKNHLQHSYSYISLSTWCLDKADDYVICIFYRHIAVLTAPWITYILFGLVRKWWYFEKNKKTKEKKPNKLKLEQLRGHLHYESGFWPLITWRIRPYKQIHNTYTILI